MTSRCHMAIHAVAMVGLSKQENILKAASHTIVVMAVPLILDDIFSQTGVVMVRVARALRSTF